MNRAILLAGLVFVVGGVIPGSALGQPTEPTPAEGIVVGHQHHEPHLRRTHVSEKGNVSILGLVTVEHAGFTIPTGTNTFNFISNRTAVAANGDEGFGTCAGPGSTPDGVVLTLLLNCPITGVTGGFEGVSGSFTAAALSTRVSVDNGIATNQAEITMEGTLNLG